MSEKRMFSKKIVESSGFYEMPATAQALYIHLNMDADDDGFNNQVSLSMFKSHATNSDIELLFAKKFIIAFEDGIIVIKHWKINNTIRKDTYKPTAYIENLRLLEVKENGAYTFRNESVTEPLRVRNVEQIRLEQNRLDKISLEQTNKDEFTICQLLTNDEFKKLMDKYDRILDLIDLVDKSINSRSEPTPILNPVAYIEKVAESNGWWQK